MHFLSHIVALLFANVLTFASSYEVCECKAKILDCSNRNLRALSTAISAALPCNGLKYIKVDRNQLSELEFPDSLAGLPSVVYVNASYNNLKSLEGIRGWTGGRLDVQNNELSTIDLSDASHLEELTAYNNVLEEILLPVGKCSLLILSLHNNRFRWLPRGLDLCPFLSYIDVSQNAITKLDVSYVKRLEYIKATNNALKTIELPTEKCQLANVNASSNNLSELSEDLLKCTKLETIDLSNNNFSKFPMAIVKLLKLRKIQFKGGDPNIPEIFVDLRRNPLAFKEVARVFRRFLRAEGRIRAFYNVYENECECAVLKLHDFDYAAVQFCVTAMCSHGGIDLWMYI